MSQPPFRRRLAALLLNWSRVIIPRSRRAWAEAMVNEMQFIEGDWQALSWAVGCLSAAINEQLRTLGIFDSPLSRLLVALLLLFKVFDDFFATVGTIVYRQGWYGTAESFGRATPGDDYTRLIPLMEGIPVWLHGLWVLAGVLYLAAIVLCLMRARAAYLLVLLAVGIEIIAAQVGQPIIDAIGVRAVPNPSIISTLVIPFALPLAIVLLLWLASRVRADHEIRSL